MSKMGIIRNVAALVELINKTSDTFHHVLDKVNVLAVGAGSCKAQLTIEKCHLNHYGTLHGGYAATLLDCLTAAAIFTKTATPMVSLNLYVNFLKSAKEGESIIINSQIIKIGHKLAVVEMQITNEKTKDLLIFGTNTALLIN